MALPKDVEGLAWPAGVEPRFEHWFAQIRAHLADLYGQIGSGTLDGIYVVTSSTYGAEGDGVTNDTAAIQSAIDAAEAAGGGIVLFPSGSYVVTASLTVTNSVFLLGLGPETSVLKPNLGASGGKVIDITGNGAGVVGLTLDFSETVDTLEDNTYGIYSTGDDTTIQNVVIENANADDGNTGATNLLVIHAVYMENLERAEVSNLRVDTVSGSCVFLKAVDQCVVRDCEFIDFQWYAYNHIEGCTNCSLLRCTFNSNTAQGVYWGGAVNIISNLGTAVSENFLCDSNEFTGVYSYGAVIRIASAEHVTIRNNYIHGITSGSLAGDPNITYIRVQSRGTTSSDGQTPCKHIRIENNTLISDSQVNFGVYVDNDHKTTRSPAQDIWVVGNVIRSVSGSFNFETGISFHGQGRGIENIWVLNNYVSTVTASGSPVGGAIGFIADNATGVVTNVFLAGNNIVDLGTPASSFQIGIAVQARADKVFNIGRNYVDNFFYGVRTFTDSGPTLVDLDMNSVVNSGSADFLFGEPLTDTRITISTSSPSGTPYDRELWGVYTP